MKFTSEEVKPNTNTTMAYVRRSGVIEEKLYKMSYELKNDIREGLDGLRDMLIEKGSKIESNAEFSAALSKVKKIVETCAKELWKAKVEIAISTPEAQ